jgi:hypothetical protein
MRRKNGGNANQILGSDTGIPQRELERSKAFFVFPDAFGQKDPSGDHVLGQFVGASGREKMLIEFSKITHSAASAM